MARTYHHDEKRFHPWKNPRSSDRAFRRLLELNPYRRGFYYCDYSSAGPRWFRSVFMERPARRVTRTLEHALAGRYWWRAYLCENASHCEGCALEKLEEQCQLDDVDGWPLARKPTIYWW